MPRDNDKNNDSRGRRDRPSGGKGRSGAARGPEKKFAKRGFAGKSDGERRPYAGKSDGAKSYGKKPYSGSGKPYAGKREGRRRAAMATLRAAIMAIATSAAFNRDDRPRRPAFADRPRARGEGEKRAYTPRGDRPKFNREDRAPRSERARRADEFQDKKFGDEASPIRRVTAIVRNAIGPMATVRRVDEEVRRRQEVFARRAGSQARGSRAAQGFRQPSRTWTAIAAIQNRGTSATRVRPTMPAAIRVLARWRAEISTDRATTNRGKTAAAMSVPVFASARGSSPGDRPRRPSIP